MNQKEILTILNEHIGLYNSNAAINTQCQIITNIETLFQQYLEFNPHDLDIWLKLIRLEFMPNFLGPDIFEEYFQKALAIEKKPIVYVLKALSEEITRYITPETYEQLCTVKTLTNEDKAMVAYMKSLAIRELVGNQPKEYELDLLESIQYGPSYFWNHIELGQYYLNTHQYEKGKILLTKGIQNVLHIYDKNDFDDPTDVHEFINERIKGIHLTDSNFNHIVKQFRVLEHGDYDIETI